MSYQERDSEQHWRYKIRSGRSVWTIFRWWGDTKEHDKPHLVNSPTGETYFVDHFLFPSVEGAKEAMEEKDFQLTLVTLDTL